GAATPAALLGEDRVVGEAGADFLDDAVLRLAVHVRDEVRDALLRPLVERDLAEVAAVYGRRSAGGGERTVQDILIHRGNSAAASRLRRPRRRSACLAARSRRSPDPIMASIPAA